MSRSGADLHVVVTCGQFQGIGDRPRREILQGQVAVDVDVDGQVGHAVDDCDGPRAGLRAGRTREGRDEQRGGGHGGQDAAPGRNPVPATSVRMFMVALGEFSQRVGVSPERLRAWEKRYGLLSPDRSTGGFRLYSDADIARVERMLAHLERGASAAEAARLAWGPPLVAEPRAAEPVRLNREVGRLRERLEGFDDAGAHAVLDELLATFALETVLRDVILPYLVELGERWRSGEVTVGQEHFASNLLRAWLLSLAQGWGQGAGPRVVLAAPPGEQHDLGLIVCGLVLSRQGLRVVFLGADSPIDTLITTVRAVRPALVLLSRRSIPLRWTRCVLPCAS